MSYQDKEPRVVKLGQKVPAFEFPLRKWHGYSSHLSMNPGSCSTLLLRSGFLPDLRFISIAQPEPENRGDDVGTFRIEADKDHLGELGILEEQRYVPGRIPLPMRPAVFGGSRWSGYYILNKETLDQVDNLRVYLYTPEGGYIAQPNILIAKGTAGDLCYSKGIVFDVFKETHGRSRRIEALAVHLKDEAFLKNMKLMFTSSEHQ